MKTLSHWLSIRRPNTAIKALGAILMIAALIGCASQEQRVVTGERLQELGRLQEAAAAGLDMTAIEARAPAGQGHWEEIRDGGDAPLEPGCACYYETPGCVGTIDGRAVDECFPDDGVTLQENTMGSECGNYGSKEYNCEDLLGPGARCRLIDLECCGVQTTSGYCYFEIQP